MDCSRFDQRAGDADTFGETTQIWTVLGELKITKTWAIVWPQPKVHEREFQEEGLEFLISYF